MELPGCKDICREESDDLCPVEFFVPIYRKVEFKDDDRKNIGCWIKNDGCFDKLHKKRGHVVDPIHYCKFDFVAGGIYVILIGRYNLRICQNQIKA